MSRDPKDEPYLNLALATGANHLVTRDKDLLDLMHDETFRAQHPGLQIIDPPALLRDLAQASSIQRPIE
jgi:predicted nucleic acid-binding protein